MNGGQRCCRRAAPNAQSSAPPRSTAGRCQLPGPTERRGSLGEGVGRCRRSWKWPASRKRRKGRRARERENRQRKRKREKGGERTRERKRLNGCTATGLHPAPALVSGTPPASPRPFVRPHTGDGEHRRGSQPLEPWPLPPRRRQSEAAAAASAAASAAAVRGSRGVAEGQLEPTPEQVDSNADTD